MLAAAAIWFADARIAATESVSLCVQMKS